MTNWGLYKRCPVCKADAGAPCESTMFATTKGRTVYLDEPHRKRKTTAPTIQLRDSKNALAIQKTT